MHGLNALQALVHEGGGVDGDLGAHGPRGMCEGIGTRHAVELVARAAKKRTARAGEPNTMSLAWVLPQIALEDGGVLRVDWNKLARLRQRHKQVATDDEGLLVGKGKALI